MGSRGKRRSRNAPASKGKRKKEEGNKQVSMDHYLVKK